MSKHNGGYMIVKEARSHCKLPQMCHYCGRIIRAFPYFKKRATERRARAYHMRCAVTVGLYSGY